MSTITVVGGGTSASGNNASVTPVAHVSTAVGDFVVVHASIRNSGTGVPVCPSGWTTLAAFGNEALFARIWDGTAIPAIAFTGGVANADTLAQAATWRGVSPEG